MKGTAGKTQRLPRFLREYRGEVPGCPGGVGAYDQYGGYRYTSPRKLQISQNLWFFASRVPFAMFTYLQKTHRQACLSIVH